MGQESTRVRARCWPEIVISEWRRLASRMTGTEACLRIGGPVFLTRVVGHQDDGARVRARARARARAWDEGKRAIRRMRGDERGRVDLVDGSHESEDKVVRSTTVLSGKSNIKSGQRGQM